MAVNLTGQWHMIRAFDPLACRAGRARRSGHVRCRSRKQAVLGALCGDQGRARGAGPFWAGESEQTNLKINMINPGGTATKMRASAFPGKTRHRCRSHPISRPQSLRLLAEDCPHHGELVEARKMI